MTKKTKKLVYTNKNKKQHIKKRKINKTKKNKNMKGGVFGGNVNKKVEKIMIDNLCNATNNGVSLNNKDVLAATNVSNLCNNRDLSKPKKIMPEFNSSGFFGTIVGVALLPFKIGANVLGNITGYRTVQEQPTNNVGNIPLNQINNNISNIPNNNRNIQKI